MVELIDANKQFNVKTQLSRHNLPLCWYGWWNSSHCFHRSLALHAPVHIVSIAIVKVWIGSAFTVIRVAETSNERELAVYKDSVGRALRCWKGFEAAISTSFWFGYWGFGRWSCCYHCDWLFGRRFGGLEKEGSLANTACSNNKTLFVLCLPLLCFGRVKRLDSWMAQKWLELELPENLLDALMAVQ